MTEQYKYGDVSTWTPEQVAEEIQRLKAALVEEKRANIELRKELRAAKARLENKNEGIRAQQAKIGALRVRVAELEGKA